MKTKKLATAVQNAVSQAAANAAFTRLLSADKAGKAACADLLRNAMAGFVPARELKAGQPGYTELSAVKGIAALAAKMTATDKAAALTWLLANVDHSVHRFGAALRAGIAGKVGARTADVLEAQEQGAKWTAYKAELVAAKKAEQSGANASGARTGKAPASTTNSKAAPVVKVDKATAAATAVASVVDARQDVAKLAAFMTSDNKKLVGGLAAELLDIENRLREVIALA